MIYILYAIPCRMPNAIRVRVQYSAGMYSYEYEYGHWSTVPTLDGIEY